MDFKHVGPLMKPCRGCSFRHERVPRLPVGLRRWSFIGHSSAPAGEANDVMRMVAISCAGSVDLKELNIDGAGAVTTGVHATLSRCLHTLNLFKVGGRRRANCAVLHTRRAAAVKSPVPQ